MLPCLNDFDADKKLATCLFKNWSLACSYDTFCIVESLLKLLGNGNWESWVPDNHIWFLLISYYYCEITEILLFQELKIKPLPTVLASFSGGSKGCMYKVIQVNVWFDILILLVSFDATCTYIHFLMRYFLIWSNWTFFTFPVTGWELWRRCDHGMLCISSLLNMSIQFTARKQYLKG
jgi:hypothetical protein